MQTEGKFGMDDKTEEGRFGCTRDAQTLALLGHGDLLALLLPLLADGLAVVLVATLLHGLGDGLLLRTKKWGKRIRVPCE